MKSLRLHNAEGVHCKVYSLFIPLKPVLCVSEYLLPVMTSGTNASVPQTEARNDQLTINRDDQVQKLVSKEAEAIVKIQTAWRLYRDRKSGAATDLEHGQSTSGQGKPTAQERWDETALHARMKVRVVP